MYFCIVKREIRRNAEERRLNGIATQGQDRRLVRRTSRPPTLFLFTGDFLDLIRTIMNFFYFTLHIDKKTWKSQSYYNDSSDFARLRGRFIDAVEWIRSFVSELNTSQFLIVVALLNRLSSLSLYDTRETVFFANDFLTINQED